MAASRYHILDPTALPVSHPVELTSVLTGPHFIGNFVDRLAQWRNGFDGLYPAFTVNGGVGDNREAQIIRHVDSGIAANRNILVGMGFVPGDATAVQIGVTCRATSTAAGVNRAICTSFNTNNIQIGRFHGDAGGAGAYQQINVRGSTAYTASNTTEYMIFQSVHSAAVGDDINVTGWMTTHANWGADLVTRFNVTEDHADFKIDTGTWGAWAMTTHASLKVTRIVAWLLDGTSRAAVAWCESDPSGPKLNTTPVFLTTPSAVKWQRSTSASSGFADLAGATTAAHQDTTAVEDTDYFYRAVWTDAGGGGGTATSEVVCGAKLKATRKIGFIGTSWMSLDRSHKDGVAQTLLAGTIPQLVAKKLARRENRLVTISNQGIAGSGSYEWLPSDAANYLGGAYYATAVAALASAGVTHVYIDPMALNDCIGTGVHRGTSRAVTDDSQVTLATSAVATNDIYNGYAITMTSGLAAGQTRTISDYTGSTRVALLESLFDDAPSAGDTYVVVQQEGTTQANYTANILAIASKLVASGYKVILGKPGAPFPSTRAGRGAAAYDLLKTYETPTAAIANNASIIAAASKFTSFFIRNPYYVGEDLLHPNFDGMDAAADIIANDIYTALNPNYTTGGSGVSYLGPPDQQEL